MLLNPEEFLLTWFAVWIYYMLGAETEYLC